ncbi:MAG: hypothetical protein CMJ49_10735 [Planctomycetaceae bacterium]|nr:hypothetical protein [Planctomycetaceae bacterium]
MIPTRCTIPTAASAPRRAAFIICAALLATSAGCHFSGQPIPKDWITTAAEAADVQDPPDTPTLQVIICYGTLTSNHGCLRLTFPDRNTLFWDPGGYIYEEPHYNRQHDVVRNNAPSLIDYWHLRRGEFGEPTMAAYEWTLSREDASLMYHVLYHGKAANLPDGKFDPDLPGLFCSIGVSRFLERYGEPYLDMPKGWWTPHGLAKHLLSQNPRRLIVFKRGKPTTISRPPPTPDS